MAHGGERKKLIPFFPVHDYLELKLLFKIDHLIKYQILKSLVDFFMKEQRWVRVFIPGLGTCDCMTFCFRYPFGALVLACGQKSF